MATERLRDARERLVVWLRRGGRHEAVPLADTAELERPARRTRSVRLALAGLLVVVVLGAVASVPEAHGRRFLPADTVAMVVLDLSSSIRPTTYKLIGAELASLSKTDQRVGVVLFSDVAYTALPPGTPASELASFARFYTDDRVHYWQGWWAAPAESVGGVVLGWDEHLLGSAPGGAAPEGHGRRARRRDPLQRPRRRPDRPPPARSDDRAVRAAAHSAAGRRPRPEARYRNSRRSSSARGSLSNVAIPTGDAGRGRLVVESPFPMRFALLAALAVVLLAANVLYTEPVTWRRAT